MSLIFLFGHMFDLLGYFGFAIAHLRVFRTGYRNAITIWASAIAAIAALPDSHPTHTGPWGPVAKSRFDRLSPYCSSGLSFCLGLSAS
jgi:hypothetical protein